MSLKSWMLSGMNRVFTRADLPPRGPVARNAAGARAEPVLHAGGRRSAGGDVPHLGRYAALIGAIRGELEDFVANRLRLHLAIAERDRFLLTSIDVESTGGEESRELLHRFTREFTPEQVRHFLAKEVIARLPNASAIDLSQFGGLAGDRAPGEPDEGAYDDLMKELRSAESAKDSRPYEVTLVGRWAEADKRGGTAKAIGALDTPSTPLSGREAMFEVDDADGRRRVELRAIAPGRRYVIGKDESCDIVVKAVYASRRHCEIWLEHGAWWVSDAGSTNGIRVEPPPGSTGAGQAAAGGSDILEVVPGAQIVLSASAQGSAAQYPRLVLRSPTKAPELQAPAPSVDSPPTPVTPIVARAGHGLVLTARMASGTRTIDVPDGTTPLRVGRSRTQTLVVDWAHQGVSGHHVDILDCDASGAAVVVHGDNGVSVEGTQHGAGARFHWKLGQTMILGRTRNQEPECSLTLSRH